MELKTSRKITILDSWNEQKTRTKKVASEKHTSDIFEKPPQIAHKMQNILYFY